MKKYRPFLMIAFLALPLLHVSPFPLEAKQARLPSAHLPEVDLKTQKVVLDNGMTVLITEMPNSFTTSVYALVKTGSATEGKYLGTGISHFLEHMLFKGTKRRPVGQIGDEIKSLGGSINASTSFDYTIYVIDVPAEHFDSALDIQADLLMNSVLDPQEVENERKVIFGEMRFHNDNPGRKLYELVARTAYVRHPYRHPIIGYKDLLANVSRDDLWDYYKKHYSPNNIILSIAGNVKTKDILPDIKKKFKDYKPHPFISRTLPEEPQQITARYYEQEYPTDLTRLALAYHSVRISHEDLFALDVLSMILGRGKTSRLHKKLYDEKRLVHTVRSSNYTPMDPGLFEIDAVLDKSNLQETITLIKEQIDIVKDRGVDAKELEKTKKQVVRDHIFGMETSGRLAHQIASDEAFTGDFQFSKNYVEGIRGVTDEDIRRVARQYLKEDNLTTVVLKPIEEQVEAAVDTTKKDETEIEKIVLDNGLTILLKENHAIPIVSTHLALNGGTRFEDVENSGLFHLLASLWAKETKSKSPEVMAELLESKGISLGGFSGRHSFGLSMDVLSEDLDEAFDILEDVVKNPQFSTEELAKQKEKTIADVTSFNDSVFKLTSLALRDTLFTKHYSRLEPLGTIETIEKIQRKDIYDVYQRLLSGDHMVLTVFGDFDSAKVSADLKRQFSKLPGDSIMVPSAQESSPKTVREKTIYVEKEQAMVMIGFHGPALNSPDRYGVDLIANVLGSSLSGRMFNRIRDELGQAYVLGAQHQPGPEIGLIVLYVLTNDDQVDQVTDIVLSQLTELREGFVTDTELLDAKTYEIGHFKMGIETNSALSFTTALDELYGLGFHYYKSHEALVNAVTKEDVQRIARKYLDPNKAVIIKTRHKKE